MIGHAVNLKHFMFILLKNACYILMQPFFPIVVNKCSSVFYCKYKLNMNLGETISQGS
jgi:hypothetical protein